MRYLRPKTYSLVLVILWLNLIVLLNSTTKKFETSYRPPFLFLFCSDNNRVFSFVFFAFAYLSDRLVSTLEKRKKGCYFVPKSWGAPIFRGKLASIIVGVLGRVFLLLFSELRISFSLINARRISTGVEKLWVLKNRIKSISKEAIKVSVLYCHCIENRMNISVFDIIRFAI